MWFSWVFVAARAFSSAVSWGHSLVSAPGPLLLRSTGPRCAGFSSCDSWSLEHSLSSCGLVALRHVGCSWTRDRNHVSCIDLSHQGRPLEVVLIYRSWSEIMSNTVRPGFTHWKLYSAGHGISQQKLTSQAGIKYLLPLFWFSVEIIRV